MKTRLNMNKIAAGLGAERRGTVSSTGGYFGAMQLRAEIDARFRVPSGGGPATDPRWTASGICSPNTYSRSPRKWHPAEGGELRKGAPRPRLANSSLNFRCRRRCLTGGHGLKRIVTGPEADAEPE